MVVMLMMVMRIAHGGGDDADGGDDVYGGDAHCAWG